MGTWVIIPTGLILIWYTWAMAKQNFLKIIKVKNLKLRNTYPPTATTKLLVVPLVVLLTIHRKRIKALLQWDWQYQLSL